MRIRVLTYNIHKCLGGIDRRYDPGRIVETIAYYEPDFVLLQEVAQNSRRSNYETQVDRLGDMLGLRHRTYFTNVRWKRKGEYGNAILSRFPLTETSNIDLTIPLKKARSVLHARFRVRLGRGKSKTKTLHVFNLHLGLSGAERKIQLRKFLDSHPFANLDHRTPLLVGGDFNDVWGTLGKKLLEPAGFRGMKSPLRTFPAYAPVRALDSLYVRGNLRMGRVQSSRLKIARAASDHLPLIADMEIFNSA
ncbi:MAG: endonuclease/exonuclease/phosphatase family protein [Planctomycetota bacterium]|jgi:endonuclease/exonuclease/phosphatase family metal-dependent hydrolase